MKGESRQGPLNRLQGRDSDSHPAARCGSYLSNYIICNLISGKDLGMPSLVSKTNDCILYNQTDENTVSEHNIMKRKEND